MTCPDCGKGPEAHDLDPDLVARVSDAGLLFLMVGYHETEDAR